MKGIYISLRLCTTPCESQGEGPKAAAAADGTAALHPGLAPAGRDSYYVLFPTPNLRGGQDWATLGPRYRDTMVAALEERGYGGFGAAIEVEQLTTPADWAARGMEAGAPFAAAHTFGRHADEP